MNQDIDEAKLLELNHLYLLSIVILLKMESLETKGFPRMGLKSAANVYKKQLKHYIDSFSENSKETDAEDYKNKSNEIHIAINKVESCLEEIYK